MSGAVKGAAGIATHSVSVRFWHDLQGADSSVRVAQVDEDEEKEVRLQRGSFILRITMDERRLLTRCSVRHIGSGQTAYVQGGPDLAEFIKDCLIEESDTK